MVIEEDIGKDRLDFSEFEDKFYKVGEIPEDITIQNWKNAANEIQGKRVPGILCSVVKINGVEVNREFFMASKRLIQAIRPFIESAEKQGQNSVNIRVFRSGNGFNTQFTVKPI